jgi:hypothetical protein
LRVLDNKDDVNDMAEGEEFRRFWIAFGSVLDLIGTTGGISDRIGYLKVAISSFPFSSTDMRDTTFCLSLGLAGVFPSLWESMGMRSFLGGSDIAI